VVMVSLMGNEPGEEIQAEFEAVNRLSLTKSPFGLSSRT
jgi:hypothetical protein